MYGEDDNVEVALPRLIASTNHNPTHNVSYLLKATDKVSLKIDIFILHVMPFSLDTRFSTSFN